MLACPPLDRMKQKLIEENYGPPRGDSDSESKESPSEDEEEEEEYEKRCCPRLDALMLLDMTDSGNPNASERKRVVLLDPKIGVTDLNWGFDSLVSAFLKPIGRVTARLQTVHQPIQHQVEQILWKMRRDVASFPKELREPFTVWRKWRRADYLANQDINTLINTTPLVFACRGSHAGRKIEAISS